MKHKTVRYGVMLAAGAGMLTLAGTWGCGGGSGNNSSGLPGGSPTREQVTRGRYLVTAVAGCSDCHGGGGSPNSAQWLAGYAAGSPTAGQSFSIGPFKTYAANITSDKATGIGSWTSQQIFNALRMGKDPAGKYLAPPMPWPVFRNMTDADIWSIVAYLQNLKPATNTVPAVQGPPGADGKPDWSSAYTSLAPLPAYPAASENNVP